MRPLIARTARFDAMRDAVVIDRADAEVVVSRDALEAWFGRAVPPEAAVARALSMEPVLRRAANAAEPDDGTVTITARLLDHERSVQDEEREAANAH